MREIRPEELRIGNFIFDDLRMVSQVSCLTVQGIGTTINRAARTWTTVFNPEPIPITEEWLLKFGFEFFKGWHWLDAFSPGHPSQRFDLYWSKQNGFMTKSRYQEDQPDIFFMRHIQYIHQVQNLYYSLTGEELAITQ